MSQPLNNISTGDTLPQKAEYFIPHSDVMCVIDQLIFVGYTDSSATAIVLKTSPFVDDDGRVEETLFVEMIAQTIGAGNGYKISDDERERLEGFLLGVKNLIVHQSAFAEEELLIKATKTAEFGDFAIVEGSVYRGTELLAQGEIKVFQKIVEKAES